ncbi:MAG: ribosomal protein S18-alanine N-acetyltransferase [Lautropia sp.]
MPARPGVPAPSRPVAPTPRPMTHADLDRVIATEVEIYPFPWSRANFDDSLVAGHEGWLVEAPTDDAAQAAPDDAARAAQLVGYAMLMWALDEVHLLNLSIAARWQGRGRGRSLLEWLCAHTAARGAASMLLEVRPSNPPALRLYESAGFDRIGLRRGYYPSFDGRREDAIVMRRLLPFPARRGASGEGPA